jgi:hypothetical protein
MTADPDIGILLALAYQQFVTELHEDLAQRGFDDVRKSDGYVFRALDAEPLTTSALAERLGISKQGAGQLVELSDRGRAALAAAQGFHRRYEQKLARRHGRGHVDDLRAMLTAMAPTYGTGGLDPRVRALHV